MENFDKMIGLRIKERRLALDLTQTELAARLGYSNKSMISLIENGKRSLNASQILPVADALECSIDDLLDGPESKRDIIIDLFDHLTEDQQDAVLQFLKATISKS